MFQNVFEGWEFGLLQLPCNFDFLGLGLEISGTLSNVFWLNLPGILGERPMTANGVRI